MSAPSDRSGSADATASRLRALRQHAGLNLAAAARATGYSVSHLSNVERGVKATLPHLVQAYEGLGSRGGRRLENRSSSTAMVESTPESRPSELCQQPLGFDADRFGTRLMRLRLERGWSLRQAAFMMNISYTHLANLESGVRPPSPQTAKACDELLAEDGSLIALADQERAQARIRPTGLDPDSRMNICLDPEAPLEVFESEFRRLRSVAQMSRPALVYPVVSAYADALAQLAADRGGRNDARWILAAQCAELAGWMAQEAASPQLFAHWTRAASRWAIRGGSRDMAAYAWERFSLDPFCHGDVRNAILLARRGAEARGVGSRVRGLAMCRVAQGHAALPGERDACFRALDSAAYLLSEEPDAAPPPQRWGSGSMPAIPAFVEAWCLIDLGRFEQAAELLGPWQQTAVSPNALRTRARYGVRTAMALVGAGEQRQAVLVIGEMLPAAAAVDSATIRADLRNLINLIVRRRSPLLVRLVPDLRNIAIR